MPLPPAAEAPAAHAFDCSLPAIIPATHFSPRSLADQVFDSSFGDIAGTVSCDVPALSCVCSVANQTIRLARDGVEKILTATFTPVTVPLVPDPEGDTITAVGA